MANNYTREMNKNVGGTDASANPMYPGKPSRAGKTAEQLKAMDYGLVSNGKSDGFTNEFSDQKGGSGRRINSSGQRGQ